MNPRRRVVTAVLLWAVFAFLVWNVVFDRIIVLAGRRYSYDATLAFRAGYYLRIDDAMRPAIAHGVRVASIAAGLIVLVGVGLIRLAADVDEARRRVDEKTSSG